MGPIEQLSYILPTCSTVVDRIHAMQLDDPTPCAKFSVRQILEHMMIPAATFTYMFQGQDPPELTLPEFDGRVPAPEFRELMDDLLGAVMSPGALERTIESPFGTMDGDTFARLVAFDGLVHSWDLATATGQHLALPPAVVDAVSSFAREALTDDMRDGDTFKQPTNVDAAVGAIEQLAAFSGRKVPVAA